MLKLGGTRGIALGVLIAASTLSISARADCTSDNECKGERVCVEGRCSAPPEAAPIENSGRPHKVKKKFVRPALFVTGIAVAALTPIALFVALFAAAEKSQCEDAATAPSLVFGTPIDDAHCSNYNGSIAVGAVAAAVFGISGTIMIVGGAKRVPIDAPQDATEAKVKIVPWSDRNAGGAALQVRF